MTDSEPHADAPARGRPRSAETHHAILEAMGRLLARCRYPEITFDAVAAEAKVGKAAIFRRWPSKAALAAESLRRMFETANPDLPKARSPRAAIRSFVGRTAHMSSRTEAGAAIRNVVSELAHAPELAAVVAELEQDRRRRIHALLAPIEPDQERRAVLMSLLFGPLYLRWLVTREPLDTAFVDAVVDHVLGGR